MSKYRLFADFGSTFTKLVAFDMEKEELAARVQAPSTVESDIMLGLTAAFEEMGKIIPLDAETLRSTVACSSAAGGLRMLCIGLVPDYTTEAGRLAALGAGAKVVGEYSFELSRHEMDEICALSADIILLTGGTDGGNEKVIIHNARALASRPDCAKHIVVAGNARANDRIREAFEGSGMSVFYADNVMPTLGKLNLGPVNELIRRLFISHITEAKGISRVKDTISEVKMPTPSAVFEAAKLIANGVPGVAYGLGDLLLVDVGGATTDVYSVCDGRPTQDGVETSGLTEPYAKRTVEGDIGLYHNLDTLARLADTQNVGLEGEADALIKELRSTRSIPSGGSSADNQLRLSRLAVSTAVARHAGTLITELTPHGISFRQKGKDLGNVKYVIGGGGPVSFSADPRYVLEGAAADGRSSNILKPKSPSYFIDSQYILFAIGLLSIEQPDTAFRIIMKYLKEV